MGRGLFHLKDHELEARLGRLPPDQVAALEAALARFISSHSKSDSSTKVSGDLPDSGDLPIFLLPLAEFGLSAEQMVKMVELIPPDFQLDHRKIYFDFRLNVWIKHIEPLTVSECLEEYLENAESDSHGMAYLTQEWQAFLGRHPSA